MAADYVCRADREAVALPACAGLEERRGPVDGAAFVPGRGDDQNSVGGGLVDCIYEDRRRGVQGADAEVDDAHAERVELCDCLCEVGVIEAAPVARVDADHVSGSAEAGPAAALR